MKDERDLLASFSAAFDALTAGLPNPGIIAGVSGGPDSLAMMHLLSRLRESRQFNVTIVHVDHQLRSESAHEAAFVMEEARRYGLPATIAKVDTRAIASERKISIETAARAGRYTALTTEAQARGSSRIFVAHTRDDQAETVLSHLIRGTGLDGLGGMKPLYPLTKSHLMIPVPEGILLGRPLLAISRAQIIGYCDAFALHPLEDSSNQDETYLRNWIRHALLPRIESRVPSFSDRIIALANIVQADSAVLESLTESALSDLTTEKKQGVRVLSFEGWSRLPLALKRRVLRDSIFLIKGSMTDISFTHIEKAISLLENSEPGSVSEAAGGIRIRREGSGIIIQSEGTTLAPDWPALTPGKIITLTPGIGYPIGHHGWTCDVCIITPEPGSPVTAGLSTDRWQAFLDADKVTGSLTLRTRVPGDRFHPQGAGGSVTVGNFMTDHHVPRAARSTLPLLVDEAGILWLCGFRVDERVTISETTHRVIAVRFYQSDNETGT